MADGPQPWPAEEETSVSETHGERLLSWKAIASFLGVTVRTAQRWEQSEGLPVHRHGHQRRATAFAYTQEIEQWRQGRSVPPDPATAQAAVPRTPAPPASREESILVLPFANVGGDPKDLYFTDGLTEELIHVLSQLRGVRVVGRTSSFSLQGQDLGLKEIARRFDVSTILEGSVRRSQDLVRVTVRLVDAQDAFQLWSKRYERKLKDIFAVQDDLTRSIRDSLQASLGANQNLRAVSRTSDMNAYDIYLKGQFYSNHWSPLRLREAAANFESALALDPAYIPAWIGLAWARIRQGVWGAMPSRAAWLGAREALNEPAKLDPDSPLVALAAGVLDGIQDHDWTAAEKQLRDAVERLPSDANCYECLARYWLLPQGRTNEAVEMMHHAVELEPMSPTALAMLGWGQIHQRQFEAAIASFEQALQLYPGSPEALWAKAAALEFMGRYEEALEVVRQSEMQAPDHSLAAARRASIVAAQGRKEQARRLYEKLLEQSRHTWVSQTHLSWAPLRLGDTETGVRHLQQAIENREMLCLYLKTDPQYDALQGTPEMTELLRRLNLNPRAEAGHDSSVTGSEGAAAESAGPEPDSSDGE